MRVVRAPRGANIRKRIVGRGRSSGFGKTSGRGHKGQKARSGGRTRLGFEGGQMPLYRRVASRGFTNHPFRTRYVVVNVSSLVRVYDDGEIVNLDTLHQKGLVKKSENLVKLLGNGEIGKKLEVTIDAISASAKLKIEKSGGRVTEPDKPATKVDLQ